MNAQAAEFLQLALEAWYLEEREDLVGLRVAGKNIVGNVYYILRKSV